MKYRRLRIITVIVFFSISGFSQNRDFDAIKSSADYIWGYGQSEDYDKAGKLALDDLIGKISVHVESSFENIAEENNLDFKEYTKSVVKTYSSVSLTNTEQLTCVKKESFYILKYIKANNLKEIFEYRENKISDYLAMGSKAQHENRIGDALRYYYWSYSLWLSHPYRDKIEINEDGVQILAGILLDSRINSIFSNINFEVVEKLKYDKEDKTKLVLSCNYKSNKVANLDFTYFSGQKKSAIQEVENGRTEIYLFGAEQEVLEKMILRLEYKYLNKSYQDKELSSVLSTVNIPFFKKSGKTIYFDAKSEKPNPKKTIKPEFNPVNKLEDSKEIYAKIIKELLIDISDKKYEAAYKYFTAGGKIMFEKLLEYGQASVLPLDDTLRIVQMDEEVIVRSVPMSFYFPGSNRCFMENVVFIFNENDKIDAVSFAVSDQTISDIVSHSSSFGNIKDKYTLIKFMEYYKTAYNLKRLEYIESIFSENALIIVGTVFKPAKPIEGMYKTIGENAVKYQRFTKKEYIERLENAFKSKEYINIDFDDATVRKINGDQKIYGIQIAQHYYSSNYDDFGYLFLMIDLNDSLNPTIYVRTWQPKKNEDGSIYGLEDFRMN